VTVAGRGIELNLPADQTMKEVIDYTPQELDRFRAAFEPAIDRYQSSSIWFFPGYFALVLGGVLFRPCPGWAKVFPCTALLTGVLLVAFAIIGGDPKCPACRRKVADKVGRYCPKCGGNAVEQGKGVFGLPRCGSCRSELNWGKRRNYKVRSCTHCGIPLNSEGF
jgi:hypothetical protein